MRDSFGRRERPRLGRRILLWAILLAIGGLGGWILWAGTGGPTARWTTPLRLVGRATPLEVEILAGRAGLRDVEVVARRPDGSPVLLAQDEFPADSLLGSGVRRHTVQLELDARQLDLPEGKLQIEVFAADHAPTAFLHSREPLLTAEVEVDLTAPRIRVLGGQHYVRQGGSDLVLYEVGEDAIESGVRVGDVDFEGRASPALPEGIHAALYTVAHDAAGNVLPTVTAVDAAGNRRTVAFPVEVRARTFASEEIRVSDGFIDSTARPLLAANDQAVPDDPIDAFLAVNRTMRRQSEERLRTLTAGSDAGLAITGAFRQQPGTKVGSRYAEHRSYVYGDQVVDHQDHLGYDLASVKQAPIEAAQTGRVMAVEDLGIYGNVVLIDHGLGLASLYAHLSSTEVEVGEVVESGAVVGRSGETGLASGDHLHFSILVSGRHVDPIEWWDPRWVRLHVLEPLAEASTGQPLGPGDGSR